MITSHVWIKETTDATGQLIISSIDSRVETAVARQLSTHLTVGDHK